MKHLLVIFIFFATSPVPFCLSQDEVPGVALPKEAADLLFEYEVLEAEIEKPIEELNLHYLNRLSDLKLEFQKEGDLDGVLVVSKESDTIQVTGKPPFMHIAEEPPQLVESRRIYEKARERLEARLAPEIRANKELFLRKLSNVKLTLTQEGRLDEALVVKNVIDEIEEQQLSPDEKNGSVTMKMQVDSMSHLFLQGNLLWYDHAEGKGAPVGQHQGDFATFINDEIEWMPVWKGDVTSPFNAGLGIPAEEPAAKLKVSVANGRGWAEIIEQPSAENDFTAKVELRDESKLGKTFLGSDWMEIEIFW
ncbi:MAG: hypothetical protein CMO55_00400 [Verrucomicrobiales bacterium]|nr:hypothetical protein [Verrucomicrobiales bacterium]